MATPLTGQDSGTPQVNVYRVVHHFVSLLQDATTYCIGASSLLVWMRPSHIWIRRRIHAPQQHLQQRQCKQQQEQRQHQDPGRRNILRFFFRYLMGSMENMFSPSYGHSGPSSSKHVPSCSNRSFHLLPCAWFQLQCKFLLLYFSWLAFLSRVCRHSLNMPYF